jgi:hypothetical protein
MHSLITLAAVHAPLLSCCCQHTCQHSSSSTCMLLQDGALVTVAAASQSRMMVRLLAYTTCICHAMQPRHAPSSVLTCPDRLQDKMAFKMEVSCRPACTTEQYQQ